jgi:hypothetical protein
MFNILNLFTYNTCVYPSNKSTIKLELFLMKFEMKHLKLLKEPFIIQTKSENKQSEIHPGFLIKST